MQLWRQSIIRPVVCSSNCTTHGDAIQHIQALCRTSQGRQPLRPNNRFLGCFPTCCRFSNPRGLPLRHTKPACEITELYKELRNEGGQVSWATKKATALPEWTLITVKKTHKSHFKLPGMIPLPTTGLENKSWNGWRRLQRASFWDISELRKRAKQHKWIVYSTSHRGGRVNSNVLLLTVGVKLPNHLESKFHTTPSRAPLGSSQEITKGWQEVKVEAETMKLWQIATSLRAWDHLESMPKPVCSEAHSGLL